MSSQDAPQVLILTALPMERRAVERALRRTGFQPVPPLHCVGLRAIRLPADDVLPVAQKPLVLFVGIAGGLDPQLQIGDVVIDAPPELADMILQFTTAKFALRSGRITTVSRPAAEPSEKQEIFSATGALAVDMEGDIACHWATARGLPFAAIRGISDTATDRLDPAIFRLVDRLGRPRPMAIAGTLMRKPGLVRHLRDVGRNARVAADNAAAVLVNFLGSAAIAPPLT